MRLSVAMLGIAICFAFATPAAAEPGMGEKVYGATVDAGVTEFESRYGRLVGDEADGEDVLKLEVAHGFSNRFYGALIAEVEHEPGDDRRLEALSVEGIYALGRVAGVDTALYGEYEIGLHGPDKLETKLLLEKRAGEFDARLNLIAEKEMEGGEPVEFEYAASADVEAIGELRVGAAAFGELGTSDRLTTHGGHFAGPILKTEIEHLGKGELEIETGYLFALGEARDEADGQLRLLLEYEVRF